jgi:hypothetical protein
LHTAAGDARIIYEKFIKGTTMAKKLSKLDSIQIPQPCSVGWEQMTGDDETRFCNKCNKRVYNLSAMTRRQAEAIIEASRGKLCARITRQEDGTTVVANDLILPATKLHHIRRASPIASVVVSAMMAVSPVMAAQTSAPAKQLSSVLSQQGQQKPGAQPQETMSKLSGSVLTANAEAIANATVTLINQETGDIRGTISKDDGIFQFDMLKPGSYSLKVEAGGFATAQTGVNLQKNQQQRVDVSMQGLRYESIGGVVATREQPLRTLYKESDLIVIATAGSSVKVESQKESNLMKTALNVISTLKGKAKKSVIYVYHWGYGEPDESFAKDKKQLVFLRHSDRGKDGYEVDDISYGVKKLSDADLTIYTQRISELAKIMQVAKPDDGQIVEWLVRCAEEKATRREGLMEFTQSFRQLSYAEEAKNEQEVDEDESEEVEAGEVEADSKAEIDQEVAEPENAEEEPEEYLTITSHMTQTQKDRVLALLYRTEEITDEEDDLIELAKDWKDAQLAPFLLAQLHRQKDAPKHFAETIIEYLVDLLNNPEVEQAAKDYSDNVSYEDEDQEEEAEKVETIESKQPETLKIIQQRSERLKAFLVVVESKIKK